MRAQRVLAAVAVFALCILGAVASWDKDDIEVRECAGAS